MTAKQNWSGIVLASILSDLNLLDQEASQYMIHNYSERTNKNVELQSRREVEGNEEFTFVF